MLAALLAFAAIAAQSGPPLVRVVPAPEIACTVDGWCTEFPSPIAVQAVAADDGRVVAGSAGGVLALHEDGAWKAGVDAGLDAIALVALDGNRVRACDERRCVDVALGATGFGAPKPAGAPTPPTSATSAPRGAFGEGGTYALQGDRLRAVVDGERVLSRAATGALGALGGPLWVAHGSSVTRYSAGARGPVSASTRFPIFCFVWCEGWNGRLFGSVDAPVLLLHHHAAEALYRFDGERFAPLLQPGFSAYKELPRLVVGEGCAPCAVGAWQIGVRRRDGWLIVQYPDVAAPKAERAHAVGVSQEGWPTVTFDTASSGEPARLQTWSFDGSAWRRGGRAPTVLVHDRSGAQRPSHLLAERGEKGRCAARLPWGERMHVDGAKLTLSSESGRRTERLPQRLEHCEVVPGADGLFVVDILRGSTAMKRWERFDPGAPVEQTSYEVAGVADDDVLHARKGPDPAAAVVADLAPGTCVQGAGRASRGRGGAWLRVATAGGPAWASARHLRPSSCAP